jgi:integral membrane protein
MGKDWKGTMGQFRLVGVLEGISYIVLLFIAMPLKYIADLPNAVKYVGWAHGVLFVAFGLLLIKVWIDYKWSFGKTTLAFVASLVPFGTFWLDKKLKKEYPTSDQ